MHGEDDFVGKSQRSMLTSVNDLADSAVNNCLQLGPSWVSA